MHLFIVSIVITSCKTNNGSKVKNSPIGNIKYADSILKEIKKITTSEYFDFSEERQYTKDTDSIFLLVYEEMNNFEGKGIGYSIVIDNNSDYLTYKHLQFYFLNNNHVFTEYESFNYKTGNKSKRYDFKLDSIFFKNNQISFWKNESISKQDKLNKEIEILLIKKEIDSILSE